MEYLLAGAITSSLIMNVILVWYILRNPKVQYFPCELLQHQPAEPEDSDEVTVISIVEPETDSVTKKEQPALQTGNHQAWNNRKNIPWSELDRPRQGPVQSERSGPRERPPGFSR